VGPWIAETAQERRRLETFRGNKPTTQGTKDDIRALVAARGWQLPRVQRCFGSPPPAPQR
jgi:hypothetical protein